MQIVLEIRKPEYGARKRYSRRLKNNHELFVPIESLMASISKQIQAGLAKITQHQELLTFIISRRAPDVTLA